MSAHTPGPWSIGNHIIGFRDERGFQRHIVEMLWDDEQGKADARLIAAAPELLKALDRLSKEAADAADLDFMGDEYHEAISKARAAIAKATQA